MSERPLLQIDAVSKAFGGVQALRDVSFDVAPGEVHALCGENGAGKSTLNKVLSGALRPDSGHVTLSGKPLPLGSVPACETAGIAIVHQESTAFLHLHAVDNVFVGREPRRLFGLALNRPVMRAKTRELLEKLGEGFDPLRPLGELTVAQRQMVSIARALASSCRLLIMDEPTSSLSARETQALFAIVRQLRAEGVSIVYVSHRLEEVFELADRVTVLRDGQKVATANVAGLTRADLVRMMVGREVAEAESVEAHATGAPVLEVRNLSRAGKFSDVSLQVRAGEVVALSGLVGAGRSEVARALFGADRPDSGEVRIGGKPLRPGSVRESLELGLAMVPEDRQHEGLALPMSVQENVTLAVLPQMARGGLLSRKREADLTLRTMRELSVKADSPHDPAESLSGGNQQKVLLGKWLATSPKVLILDEPTRGVDVAAKAEVHRLVRDLAAKGVAILLISSEMPEVLALADRTLVMREGEVAGELSRAEATQEKLLELALPQGGKPKRAEKKESLLLQLARKREYGVGFLLALTIVVVSLVNPVFLSAGNIRDMLVRVAPAAIAACGMTLVLLTREIDISIGSLMGLSAAVLGIVTSPGRMGGPVWLGVLLALALGAGIGLVNGVLVAYGKVPSIIVTLGMLTLLRGVTEVVMGGNWITELPPGLRLFGTGAWLGVPICVWTALACMLFTAWLLARTPLGRRIVAVGSSPRSAAYAGVSPTKIRLFVFAFTGLLTAVATLVSVPQLSTIESGIGLGFELLVITCVVVGGTSTNGGKGGLLGSALGVLLLGIVATVLIFLRLGDMSTYWERAVQGAFILVAVLADHVARRRSAEEGLA